MSRVARGGANHSGDFLTVLFPHNQMQILAYNRFVKGLNGLTAATFMERVGALASIEEVATSFEPKEKVLPRFQWNQILYSTAGVGGARVLASLGAAKGADFHPDAVGGRETVLMHSDPRLERLTKTFAPPGCASLPSSDCGACSTGNVEEPKRSILWACS